MVPGARSTCAIGAVDERDMNMQLWQPPLAPRYHQLSEDQLVQAIHQRKTELGDDLIILGHHYQQDAVIQFADFTGDSFKLSQLAAQRVKASGARYVIFLGVHFMAESADILTPDATTVILPDLGAGCSMADMADDQQADDAWQQIHDLLDEQGGAGDTGSAAKTRVIPICYMNSSAAIKAMVGAHGGAVCTSSNCRHVFDWALAGGTQPLKPGEQIKILFLPDQHLGRNTAAQMGYDPATQMTLWDPQSTEELGGNAPQQILESTFILWKGHCSVHKLFRPEHVDQVRAEWPDVRVIVHPECMYEVVQKADEVGSTEGILKAVRDSEPGTRWAVGTEVHMVTRLANEAAPRDVSVRILSDCQCLCTTMYRIDMPHLLWTLDELAQGRVVNPIRVDKQVAHWSMVALNRMLELTGKAPARSPEDAAGTTVA